MYIDYDTLLLEGFMNKLIRRGKMSRMYRKAVGLSLASIAFFGYPVLSFAATASNTGVEGDSTHIIHAIEDVVMLVLAAFSLMGVFLVGSSIYGMYSDHKNKQPMGHRFMGLIGGAMLLVIPLVIGIVIYSVQTGGATGYSTTQSNMGFESGTGTIAHT